MKADLPKSFLKIAREDGIYSAKKTTKSYFGNRYDFDEYYLKLLRLKSGNTIIREINGSKMELDIRSDSPNKMERRLSIRKIRETAATETFRDILNRLKKVQNPPIHVFDIGANIGYFALLEANILGEKGNIYAIEAEPNNTERLKHNIKLNDYSKIEVSQIAIGAENTQLELALRDRSNVHRMNEIIGDKPTVGTVEVNVHTLDSLVSKKGIPKEDIIIVRMDIEGYEAHAFEGMSELLASDRPLFIFAEIHPQVESVDPARIAKMLTQHEFAPEHISFDGGDTYRKMSHLDEIRTIESNAHIMVSRKI